jgi:CheY-like chemotaxis protein
MVPTPLVLVADDNRDAADSLALALALAKYRVRTAYDGREALDAATREHPDVMVLDIGMPKLTGFEVATAIGRGAHGKRPLLIAVTGRGLEGDRLRAQFAGFDHYFTKPLDPADLIRTLAGESNAVRHPEESPRRVLVADDNRDWTDEMVDQLRDAGYWVRAAYDGREALDVANLFSPQVAILDARMPRMSGHEAARVFARHPRGTRPVLIAISAYEGERESAARAGFQHFVAKPVDAATLAGLFHSAPI